MQTGVRFTLPLRCGHCPTRRVLGHIRVYEGRGELQVMVTEEGRRQYREKQATPVNWQPVTDGEPLRRRCKLRHDGKPRTREELLAAYERAVAAGRRELVLGVDV